MSKGSIVDTGVPPSNVTERKKRKDQILDDKDEEVIKAAQTKKADFTPSAGFSPKPKIRTFEVILRHELYKITIEVLDISISDFQIALKIPRAGFKFEPIPQSAFTMRTKGKDYVVTYLGGLFDFPSDDHWTITFLMEQKPIDASTHEKIMQTFDLDKE